MAIAFRASRQSFGEGVALDELEDQCGVVAVVFEPMNGADVRMVECGQQPRLARKSRSASGVCRERLRQHLDRDVATELGVASAIDLAHTADAQRSQNLVGTDPIACRKAHSDASL